jgi:hypothetical protein
MKKLLVIIVLSMLCGCVGLKPTAGTEEIGSNNLIETIVWHMYNCSYFGEWDTDGSGGSISYDRYVQECMAITPTNAAECFETRLVSRIDGKTSLIQEGKIFRLYIMIPVTSKLNNISLYYQTTEKITEIVYYRGPFVYDVWTTIEIPMSEGMINYANHNVPGQVNFGLVFCKLTGERGENIKTLLRIKQISILK